MDRLINELPEYVQFNTQPLGLIRASFALLALLPGIYSDGMPGARIEKRQIPLLGNDDTSSALIRWEITPGHSNEELFTVITTVRQPVYYLLAGMTLQKGEADTHNHLLILPDKSCSVAEDIMATGGSNLNIASIKHPIACTRPLIYMENCETCPMHRVCQGTNVDIVRIATKAKVKEDSDPELRQSSSVSRQHLTKTIYSSLLNGVDLRRTLD